MARERAVVTAADTEAARELLDQLTVAGHLWTAPEQLELRGMIAAALADARAEERSAVRQRIADRIVALELATASHANQAAMALEKGNYSSAATWSHRAHQVALQVEQLRSVAYL